MRLLKVVVVLGLLIIAGLAGYAYLGDMKADPQEMRVPVELDLGNDVSPPAQAPAAGEAAPAAAAESASPESTAPKGASNDAPTSGPDDLD